MRSFSIRNRTLALAVVVGLSLPLAACKEDAPDPGPPTISITNTPNLPPVYTPDQCAALVSRFPGWANVAPVPEYDAQGRPTIFYAAIPITNRQQLDDLKTVGIHTDSL